MVAVVCTCRDGFADSFQRQCDWQAMHGRQPFGMRCARDGERAEGAEGENANAHQELRSTTLDLFL
jgi:hypothetical protein